ncbi:MAG TPA: FG-GAP-like repeat-containing protein [Pyrinomonadaceae bacterium]
MKIRTRQFASLVLCLVFIPLAAPPRAGTQRRARGGEQTGPTNTREEAYRANNLGVALLEQFRHADGAEQFRRALRLDPGLALARINLAVALFNVPDADAARREAEAAVALAPRAPQPHYILGLIARSQNRPDDALASFRRVLDADARDVGALVNTGQLLAQQRKYPEAVEAFRAALSEEPYNGTALYNLGTALLRAGQREEGQRMIERFQALRQSGAATVIGPNYLEQGRYAEAVASTGAEPDLVDPTTPRVAFTDATASVMPQGRAAGSRRARRAAAKPDATSPRAGERKRSLAAALGGGVTLFDFDSDGDLDLFEVTPTSQRLRRNDGGRLVDVTSRSGALAEAAPGIGIGALAGDFNNDERPDLFVLRNGALNLYRNEGRGLFADVTAAAGIPAYPHLSISAAFLDADHDGDLDIFVAGFAQSATDAARESQPGEARRTPVDAPNLLLRNNGDGAFKDFTAEAGLSAKGNAVAVVPTDYDNRRDVDLLVVYHDKQPALYRNLRDGTFRDVGTEAGLRFDATGLTCAAAGDVNKDGFTDFYFGRGAFPGYFAMSDGKGRFNVVDGPAGRAESGMSAKSVERHAAQFLDYDNDGLLDLVAVAINDTSGEVGVWRNTGRGWADVSEHATRGLFSAASDARPSPRVLVSGDVDADGDTDLVFRREGGPLVFARNEGGNRRGAVRVRLAGKVSNRSGVGAKVEMRAGSLSQKHETYSAMPAPAPADVVFGLGGRARADAVRVLWPAGIVQAETEISATGAAAVGRGRVGAVSSVSVTELDRKPSSCPYLYTWNGERFEFITDFLGGGELGYWLAPGVRSAPDTDEYVRVRGDQLKARGGRYEIRVTNELEEVLFLDRLRLVAVDHPAGVEVYPNEGLGRPDGPALKLYATRSSRAPFAARDEHGHDVLARIAHMDRRYPDDFALHRIRGYAEEHTLTLDLGRDERRDEGRGMRDDVKHGSSYSSLIPPPSPLRGRTLLLLTGWTDYAFSSDNVAAAQSGMKLRPPALQVKDAGGRWQTVIEDIGVPVGRPQTVVVDLTGKLPAGAREVRVVTNMRVYWDQVLLDTSGGDFPVKMTTLEPASAELRWRGFSAEETPDGREPYGYDYARVSHTSPWKVMPGRYTREGDVLPLLLGGVDDMFVVARPGDEAAISFDAAQLPALPVGWARTFLIYADGFSKEMDLNSSSPDTVAPLPFHGMKNYPYGHEESYPATPAHRDYIERYNTRIVAAPVSRMETMLTGVR